MDTGLMDGHLTLITIFTKHRAGHKPSAGRVDSGFTVQELMIALAIAGILLGLAVPSFQTALYNNRLTSQANQLIAALNSARSEALKRGVRVTICKSTNQQSCSTSNSAYWRKRLADFCRLEQQQYL